MVKKSISQNIEVRTEMRGGPGHVQIRHLANSDDFAAKVRLCAEMVIPPGSGIGKHDHVDEDEIYIVKYGSGLLDDNGEEKTVSAGDTIITGRGAYHSLLNNGKEDLVITAVIVRY